MLLQVTIQRIYIAPLQELYSIAQTCSSPRSLSEILVIQETHSAVSHVRPADICDVFVSVLIFLLSSATFGLWCFQTSS